MTWLSLNHALLTPPGMNNRVDRKRYDNKRTCSGGDSMRNCRAILSIHAKIIYFNTFSLSLFHYSQSHRYFSPPLLLAFWGELSCDEPVGSMSG